MNWFPIAVLLLLGLSSALGQTGTYDGSVTQCNAYVATGATVAVGTSNVSTIASAVRTKLAQLTSAGPSCQTVMTELICRSAFQLATLNGPSRPCATVCSQATQYCWETFQIAGAAALLPNCSATDAFGALYPAVSTTYVTIPVACQAETSNPVGAQLTPSFYCDTFAAPTSAALIAATKLTYSLCPTYVPLNSAIFITDRFSQFQIAAGLVEPKLQAVVAGQTAGLPSSCVKANIELICKTAFNPCISLPPAAIGSPVTVYAPRPPCRSLCDISFNQCAEPFLISSNLASLPNCNVASAFPGQVQYPTTGWSFTINGQTLALPCNPPVTTTPAPTFHCEAFNATLTPTCAKYITYDILIPPPFYSQAALSAYISTSLSSTSALPSACKSYAEEFICTAALQRCSQTNVTLPSPPSPAAQQITFYMGEPPCNAMCTTFQKQCAQVFSLVGSSSSIPDCTANSSSTGQKTYPDTGLYFPFSPQPVTVPCRPTQLSKGDKPFSCEKFKGSPKECRAFVDYEFMVTPEFSQSYIAKTVAANLEGTDALPDASRVPLQEFICHAGFQRCQPEEVNDITFNWGRPPCRSGCEKTVEQIENIFVLAGNSDKLPDCTAISTTNGQASYPKTELTYTAFGSTMNVKCNPSTESMKYKDSPVRCEKYTGKASFCEPYLNTKSVFVNDLLPFETSTTVLQQLYDLYLEAPDDCREYIHKIGCYVLLPDCEVESKGLPVKMAFPKPPCNKVCTEVPDSCQDFWDKTGLPKPNCKELDSLTSQSRYPKSSWEFKYSKTKITASCVTPKDA